MAEGKGANPVATNEDDVTATNWNSNYWEALVQYTETEPGEPALGEFSSLQRMNLTHIMNELFQIKATIKQKRTTDPNQMTFLRQALHQYGKYEPTAHYVSTAKRIKLADAIRDFEYLENLGLFPRFLAFEKRMSLSDAFPQTEVQDWNNAYDTTYRTLQKDRQKHDAVRAFLIKGLPSYLTWTDAERRGRRAAYAQGYLPELYSSFVNNFAEIIIAFFGALGGCALIVPMYIMALHLSITKSLVTVSVAVVLFAFAMGFVFKTNNKDTITATATYAAVLVVFVGTSSGAGGNGSGG